MALPGVGERPGSPGFVALPNRGVVHSGRTRPGLLLAQPGRDIARPPPGPVDAASEQHLWPDPPQMHLDPRRTRVEGLQPLAQGGAALDAGKVALGDQQPVRHGDLAHGLPVFVELFEGVGGGDRRDDAVALVAGRDEPFLGQGGDHRNRIGQAGGFDHHPGDRRDLAS